MTALLRDHRGDGRGQSTATLQWLCGLSTEVVGTHRVTVHQRARSCAITRIQTEPSGVGLLTPRGPQSPREEHGVKVNAECLVSPVKLVRERTDMCVLLQNKGTEAKDVTILILSDLLKLGSTGCAVTI